VAIRRSLRANLLCSFSALLLTPIGDTPRLELKARQAPWWGPGAPDVGEWGDIYYAGKVHFEP
jgi:hypothetical protein